MTNERMGTYSVLVSLSAPAAKWRAVFKGLPGRDALSAYLLEVETSGVTAEEGPKEEPEPRQEDSERGGIKERGEEP